jgi:hypothetical protein
LSSSASHTSIDSDAPTSDDSNSAELLEDSSTTLHKRHLAHFPHAAQNATCVSEGLRVLASDDDGQREFDPVSFSTKFAAQVRRFKSNRENTRSEYIGVLRQKAPIKAGF